MTTWKAKLIILCFYVLLMTKKLLQRYKIVKIKSQPISDINMSLNKNVITKIVQPFGHICNVSFQTSVFPSKIKMPKLLHFFSAVKRMYSYKLQTNIIVTSILKNSGEIIYCNNRMDKFVKKYDILSPSQYGFRSSMIY